MRNLRVNWKRVLALGTTIALLGTGGYFGIKKRINYNDGTKENTVGYDDFFDFGIDQMVPFFNDVRENNFVVLDVGDHDDVSVHFQKKKIKYCNEHSISLGIVLSTDSTTEDAIYDDVEYVKGILSNYSIDYPVYLNIDGIITNDDLNVEMKTKLMKDFLEKCSANNIYVGLYGTDTNLCRVKKYCGITNYDAFLVMDDDSIQYNGDYNVYKDLEGNIYSKTNLAKAIKKRKLNLKDKFTTDGAYIFDKDDDLLDIALQYGMSVNELLEFNEMHKEDVHVGTVLRIPMIIGKVGPIGSGEYMRVSTPLRGCDISYAQGSSPDWDKLRDQFDFIILKCSQGLNVDSCFEVNALNCNTSNIPIGVYCYNGFDLRNCSDIKEFNKKQKEQVEFTLKNLNNKRIDYPVYFDIEAPKGKSLKDILSKKYVKDMLKIWNDKVSLSGYIPGIYCNQSGFKYLQECVDYDLGEKFELWIAGGDQYTGENQDVLFEDVVPSSVLNKDYGAVMAQSTDSAIGAGAYNGLGHLDINFCLVDYTKELVNTDSVASEDEFSIKEFNRVDYPLALGSIAFAIGSVGGAIGVIKHKSKKKIKRKEKDRLFK